MSRADGIAGHFHLGIPRIARPGDAILSYEPLELSKHGARPLRPAGYPHITFGLGSQLLMTSVREELRRLDSRLAITELNTLRTGQAQRSHDGFHPRMQAWPSTRDL